jgi:hypothetical protein
MGMSRKLSLALAVPVIGLLLALPITSQSAAAGSFDWVSRDYNGGSLDDLSNGGQAVQQGISSDGRYVLFSSYATDVVPNDINGYADFFVRDRQTGTNTLVSVSNDEQQGNGDVAIGWAALSGDGRYVAFSTKASNFYANDFGDDQDVFLRDIQAGTTTLVCSSPYGFDCDGPAISRDGRYITYRLANPFNYNAQRQIFRFDRATNQTLLVSQNTSGVTGSSVDVRNRISGDGRYVVFTSGANNLVPNDTNNTADVFRRDMQTGAIVRASTGANNTEANNFSQWPSISDDGRFVTFGSFASNFVPNDTNNDGDLFLKDMSLGTVQVVGGTLNGSMIGALTGNGLEVVFETRVGLAPNDTQNIDDAYVWNRVTNASVWLSQSSEGNSFGMHGTFTGDTSTDGRFVSLSTNNPIDPADTGTARDVYVHDRGADAVDKVRPVVTFTEPTSFTEPFTNGPTVTVTASDSNGLRQLVIHVYTQANQLLNTCGSATQAQLEAGTMSCDLSSLPSGSYYIKAGAFDNAGNNKTINSGVFVINRE